MTALLAVRDLFKFYAAADAKVPILQGTSFAVEEGEFVCVMGPSGSGKTSLLHLASGLDDPDAGSIELAGQKLGELDEHQRTLLRRNTIGHVFQFFNLLPNLDVIENVGLPIAISGQRPAEQAERLKELLARFGLAGREHSFPHQLSGGEMQRVSIARALSGGQPLILADEPTGNLSQKAGQEVMEILRTVCDEDGKSVLLVTHNPRDATFADRVLFLVDGALSADRELRGPGLQVEAVHEALAALHI